MTSPMETAHFGKLLFMAQKKKKQQTKHINDKKIKKQTILQKSYNAGQNIWNKME